MTYIDRRVIEVCVICCHCSGLAASQLPNPLSEVVLFTRNTVAFNNRKKNYWSKSVIAIVSDTADSPNSTIYSCCNNLYNYFVPQHHCAAKMWTV